MSAKQVRLHNVGQRTIQFGETSKHVLKPRGVAVVDIETGARQLRLYPKELIDLDNLQADYDENAVQDFTKPEAVAPKAPKAAAPAKAEAKEKEKAPATEKTVRSFFGAKKAEAADAAAPAKADAAGDAADLSEDEIMTQLKAEQDALTEKTA